MKILLTNHYAGTLAYGGATRPFIMAREWVSKGHDVTIVAASWTHGRSQHPEISGALTVEEIEGVRYVWLKTPAYKGNGASRVLNMMTFVTRLGLHGKRLARDYRPDVVIASSNYPLDGMPAHRIAKRCGSGFLVEVHDLWPLTPILLGGASPRHPFIMMLQYGEDYGYRHADYVVSMLPHADPHMHERGMAPHKYVHIPNGVHANKWKIDPDLLPETHRSTLDQLKDEKRFLIGYAGAHGLANALDTLIDTAAIMRNDPATFVLVGDGLEKQALQQRAESLGLNNVHFLPRIPKLAVPAFLHRMDALYAGARKNPLYVYGITFNKLFEYMMAARPVIYALEAGNNPVAEAGCGVSPGADDPKTVAASIRDLMSLPPAERAEMGRRGQAYVREHHDYLHLAERFLDVMEAARESRRQTDAPTPRAR